MRIVIDIPDEQIEKSLAESKYIHENEGEKGSVNIVLLYTNKKLEFVDISRKTDFYSLTDKYTVLPKGHGRLIDSDLLDTRLNFILNHTGEYKKTTIGTGIVIAMAENLDAPTVLDAEAERSSEG